MVVQLASFSLYNFNVLQHLAVQRVEHIFDVLMFRSYEVDRALASQLAHTVSSKGTRVSQSLPIRQYSFL